MTTGGGRKIAVVTGGTAGVGRATVRELAGRGYDVAILARGAAGLQGAAADVRKAGRQALPSPGRRRGGQEGDYGRRPRRWDRNSARSTSGSTWHSPARWPSPGTPRWRKSGG